MTQKPVAPASTLLIQSHTEPLPHPWIERCLASVRCWATAQSFDYRFVGDEIFEAVPPDIVDKTSTQPVVAADLARLLAVRAALAEGYDTVVWCDADFLCFAPAQLQLPDTDFGLGREVWVQAGSAGLKANTKVHNAFLFFRQGNAFLDFYIDSAQRLARLHEGRFAPQFLGPKLLTAIHNVVQCPVVEPAGMLSPLVVTDLLRGGGPALTLFRRKSPSPLAGANLCASLCATGQISDADVTAVIGLLLAEGTLL